MNQKLLFKTVIQLLIFSSMLLFFSNSKVIAEDIYLENGEVVRGKIIDVTDDYITLESELGYGRIEIPRDQIISSLFPASTRLDLSRRYGVGYMLKNANIFGDDNYNYNVDQLSFRTYAFDTLFIDFLLGYSNVKVDNSVAGSKDSLYVARANLKIGNVIYRRSNVNVYYGGTAGVVYIHDSRVGISELGFSGQLFIGVELFFEPIPDFGFFAEAGISYEKSKKLEIFRTNVTSLPSLGMHYYF